MSADLPAPPVLRPGTIVIIAGPNARYVVDGGLETNGAHATLHFTTADGEDWSSERPATPTPAWQALHDGCKRLGIKFDDTTGGAVEALLAEVERLRMDAVQLREAFDSACGTVAEMHAAAVGEVRGPIRGVVEDVADLRAEVQRLVRTTPPPGTRRDHAGGQP